MPTIAEALAEGERSLFVGRRGELALFEHWLDDNPRLPEIVEVTGPGGIGKTSLLAAFRRLAEQRGRPVVEVDLRGLAGTPSGLLEALGGSDPGVAAAQLNTTRPLVLLDTFEEARDVQHVLAEDLLPRLDTSVKLVVAGRFRLSHAWRTERPGRVMVRSLSLSGLAPEEGRAYLARRGVTDRHLIDQILQSVGGHPLALSLAADLVLNTHIRDFSASPERHLLIRSLAEQLLRGVADPELRMLVEASAIVEQFDQPTLEAIVGQSTSATAFEQLCRLSVVRPAQHGLMLHDEVRRILADDLRWRHNEQYSQLRGRAADYYRDRMRSARVEDREWLLAQRLYLWEHAFMQAFVFGQDDSGEVWVEPGTPEAEREALDIEMVWHTQILPSLGWTRYELDPQHDPRAHATDTAHLLALPGRRLRIARDQDGQALGFSLVAPLCAPTAEYLAKHRIYGPLLRAYLDRFGWDSLPATPHSSRIAYFLQATHKGIRANAVNAALWRELFGLFAGEGVILITLAGTEHKQLFGALGFEPLPAEYPPIWGMELQTEGYMLDLRRVGLEAWIEAIEAGRRPPRVLASHELERAVQDALAHWRDDAWLTDSALAHSPAVAHLGMQPPSAHGVRLAIRQALEQASVGAPPEQALALRAVERAYLARTISHERAAEELAVSRATFYRLLRRGVQALARAIENA